MTVRPDIGKILPTATQTGFRAPGGIDCGPADAYERARRSAPNSARNEKCQFLIRPAGAAQDACAWCMYKRECSALFSSRIPWLVFSRNSVLEQEPHSQ